MHNNLLNPTVPTLAPLDCLRALRSGGGLAQPCADVRGLRLARLSAHRGEGYRRPVRRLIAG